MSKIQWTDETWNPVTGCSKVSPGCAHCYAESVADRLWAKQYPFVEVCAEQPKRPRQFTDVWTHEDRLSVPLRRKKPTRYFVNSMSDLFHEAVPDAFIGRVFETMACAKQHTFQILTKRAERMRDFMVRYSADGGPLGPIAHNFPHVWLGVSVENQRFADERIPLLLQTPAAVRFLSCEPLLERVDLTNYLWTIPGARLNGLHWIIVGGESGNGARPFDLEWCRWLVAQGRSADVSVFVKQLGRYPRLNGVYPDGFSEPSSLRDRKGGDPSEWPEDLRVREFPA